MYAVIQGQQLPVSKVTQKMLKETARYLYVRVDNDYGGEDISYNFPFHTVDGSGQNILTLKIDLKEKKIVGWEEAYRPLREHLMEEFEDEKFCNSYNRHVCQEGGKTYLKLFLKVRDAGIYFLTDENDEYIIGFSRGYVPHGLLQVRDSDYLSFEINPDNGQIISKFPVDNRIAFSAFLTCADTVTFEDMATIKKERTDYLADLCISKSSTLPSPAVLLSPENGTFRLLSLAW